MSESPLSDVPLPSDQALEHALRHAVQVTYKNGDMAELTVKRIRTAAEKDLGLQEDFFKQGEWKIRSKEIIANEVDAQSTSVPPSSQPESAKVTPVRKAPKPRPKPLPSPLKKRSSPDDTKVTKRRKVQKEASEDEISGVESPAEFEQTPKQVPPKNLATQKISPKKAHAEKLGQVGRAGRNAPVDRNSESEMSEVLDEAPKAKSRKRQSGSREPKSNAASKKKDTSKSAKSQEPDPDTEEIKRLQGWLMKCGIRKMWFKELAPYETPKAKIRHLREMLADAGMTGRYSIEKAEEIRERRELAADLEAVQEGAKHWGSKAPDNEESGRPRRQLAKGLQSLDFLNDDDGEESD